MSSQLSHFKSIDGYIVGAYAASPAHSQWDSDKELAYFRKLEECPLVAGLELPWLGDLHPHDTSWLLTHLPSRFEVVLTDVGRTVGCVANRPEFGLGATDPEARAAALAEVRLLRDGAARLADAHGRAPIVVELHAAPAASRAGVNELAASLEEIAGLDWGGARLVIEHCDAEVPGRNGQKGWMRLGDELAAIDKSGAPVGIFLNWGRSAIELRDPDAVVAHLAMVSDAGVLDGMMLSGAAATESAFGPAWVDAHLPFASSTGVSGGDPDSLLSGDRISASVAHASSARWWGVKLGWHDSSAGPGPRVRMVNESLQLLDELRRISPRS